ncbi:TPA: hypothetical protein VDU98_005427 [Pseudomonas aeruginosa]|nr:hypothetical protein [Pseudomonas aeruginosa]
MSAFMGSARETQIASVRVRRGWFGKLILQVRYKVVRARLNPPGQPVTWEDAGVSEWRDANGNDLAESLMVAKRLGLSDA